MSDPLVKKPLLCRLGIHKDRGSLEYHYCIKCNPAVASPHDRNT